MRSVAWDGDWSRSQSFDSPDTRWWYVQQGFGAGHNGVDWAVPNDTPLRAIEAGTITEVAYHEVGYGHHLRWVTPEGYEWLYAHMRRVDVSEGQWVDQGTYLGPSDFSGIGSSGPHLHVGLRGPAPNWSVLNGYIDPEPRMTAIGFLGHGSPQPAPAWTPSLPSIPPNSLLPVALALGGAGLLLLVLSD